MKTLKDINEISSFACMSHFFANWKEIVKTSAPISDEISYIKDIDKSLSTLYITNKIVAEKYAIETLFLNQKELSSLLSFVKIEKIPVDKNNKLEIKEAKEIVFPEHYDAKTIFLRNDPNQIGFRGINIKLNSDTGAFYQFGVDLELIMNHPDVLNTREDLLNLIYMSQDKKTKKIDAVKLTFGWNDIPDGMNTVNLSKFDIKTTSLILNMRTYSLNIEETGKTVLTISFIGTSENAYSDSQRSNGAIISEFYNEKAEKLFNEIKEKNDSFFDLSETDKTEASKKIDELKKIYDDLIFISFKDTLYDSSFLALTEIPKKIGYTFVEDIIKTTLIKKQTAKKLDPLYAKYYGNLFTLKNQTNEKPTGQDQIEESIVKQIVTQISDGSERYFYNAIFLGDILSFFQRNYRLNNKTNIVNEIVLGTFDVIKKNSELYDTETFPLSHFILPLNLVYDWFFNLLTSNGVNSYTLSFNDIIDSLFNDLVFNLLNSYNELREKYVPKSALLYDLYITYDNKFFQRTVINNFDFPKEINSIDISKYKTDDINPFSFLYIYGQGRFFGNGDVKENLKNNVYHFFVGADTGFLKNVKFNPIPNAQRATSMLYSALSKKEDIRSLKGISRFDCTLNLVGNSYFKPGQVIYLDMSLMGFGNAEDEGSIAFRNNIGGYYIITKVEHNITPHYFDTSIICVYHDSGKKGKPN